MLDKVKKIISDQLNVPEDRITLETNLEELGVDSLDTLEMLMAFEDEYDIRISNDDAQNLRTVQDILDCIEKKRVEEKK